jgi:hypothetical protein
MIVADLPGKQLRREKPTSKRKTWVGVVICVGLAGLGWQYLCAAALLLALGVMTAYGH